MVCLIYFALLVCEDCDWLVKLASLARTMLDLLDLRKLRLARSLAVFASLARIETDLAFCLFGWRSLLDLAALSNSVTLVFE